MGKLLDQIKPKYKGIFFILCSAAGFGMMNTFVRLSGDVPSIQKSFFRNLIAFFFALLVVKKERIAIDFRRGNLKYLFLRSAFGTIGILGNFYAVDHLVLSDATMLNKMSPFFAILFSFLILKERVDIKQGLAVAIAFIGSLLIVKPTFSNLELLPSLIGLAGGIGAGMAYTMVRILGLRGEKGPFIVLFFSGFSTLCVTPYLLLCYQPMALWQLGYLLLAGLAAALAQFSITAAYSCAPAREISIYEYVQVLFTAIIGFFLFDQLPDVYSVAGYFIICSMAVAMFLHNNRTART